MASFSVFLEVGGSRYPLTYYHLYIHQYTDSLGRPASLTLGGTITVELHSPGQNDTVLTEWMLSPTRQYDGFVHLYRDDSPAKLKTVSFFNAYLVDMREHFSATGSGPMLTQLVISPQRVAVGGIVHDNNWPVESHGAGITYANNVPEPQHKPKQGLTGIPTFPDIPNPSKTPPLPKPSPADPVPPSRTPPRKLPQIPRNPSRFPPLAAGVLAFIAAMLYPHDAGVANEWVAQLPPEDEQRWQELEKKRKELQKEGKVLPVQEGKEWLALDTKRFPYGRDGNGSRPRANSNKGNDLGKRREEEVARITGGTVAKDPKGQDIVLRDKNGHKTGLDVLGP